MGGFADRSWELSRDPIRVGVPGRLNPTCCWRGVAGGFCHGNSLPCGSDHRCSCPFEQITVPSPSRMMRAGIVVTENLSRRAVPSSPNAAVCVMAAHGIVAKYRSVASASWHRDMSTTSKGGMFLFIGVQWAHLLA
jgi:hypothetical protein